MGQETDRADSAPLDVGAPPFPDTRVSSTPVPVDSRAVLIAPGASRGWLSSPGSGQPAPIPPVWIRKRRTCWRTAIAAGVAVGVLLATLTAIVTVLGERWARLDPSRGADPPGGVPSWVSDSASGPNAGKTPPSAGAAPDRGQADGLAGGPAASTPKSISISATGDVVLGVAPDELPVASGAEMFRRVRAALTADLRMANLEQTLTADTGTNKCELQEQDTCYAFRAPPAYAAVLRDAGFGLVNLANNHAYDFGFDGYEATVAALDRVGIPHAGRRGAATVILVNGVRVGVVGFAPYPWANDPNDLAAARSLIEEAGRRSDIVVVQAHLGAEGADQSRVPGGEEHFLGESRGDPIRFAHAVVDAGADLVIGHGPGVMRAMEFYQGRLIAYSLGTFTWYGTSAGDGPENLAGILTARLRSDGELVTAGLVPTTRDPIGLPVIDSRSRALAAVRELCESDFPVSGALVNPAGKISPRGADPVDGSPSY